ncbi:roadblock/LC7 domain-containing protein [Actinomadura algeriensis]|uniref:Regulator of Ras-like GTPase activity (Roadblock/LC7/MglB family) n=1 Tax=Actinomadura algeriensis TaxID=1679523 RepID=A0ABR9JIQ0_9ACTN|nr:roadblock/LC7 domain-containing protein [Actinomadura algeriensis]MBE1530439.1 putative regulator of Ras-like GTPase activity (Roadblock/LC7/MglB family) [Actinomadura algeriensis]
MTTLLGESSDRLNWLIDGLVERVPQVTRAVLQSADGLVLGSSSGLDRADADYLSALAAGLQSLAQGARTQFDATEARQTIIEMSDAFLFVTAAGEGASLTVMSDAAVDPAQISYEMTTLVRRVGEHLATRPRER